MFPKYVAPLHKITPVPLFYAETVHDRIERLIKSSEKKLKEGQSLKVEVLLNNGNTILPDFFGYQNPCFIIVNGKNANGDEVEALISHTNIQILFTIINKQTGKSSIGFQVRDAQSDEEQSPNS
jgi:hypothetical protein